MISPQVVEMLGNPPSGFLFHLLASGTAQQHVINAGRAGVYAMSQPVFQAIVWRSVPHQHVTSPGTILLFVSLATHDYLQPSGFSKFSPPEGNTRLHSYKR